MHYFRFLMVFSFLFLIISCGGGETEKVLAPDLSKGVLITPDTSYKGQTDNRSFELSLLEGTTETDFTLTVTASNSLDPETDQAIVSNIYTITPKTQLLLRLVRITISLNTSQFSNGKLFIARKEGDVWLPITSTVSATNVSAEIAEFGQFGVFYQEKKAIDVTKTIGPVCNSNVAEQNVRFIHVADLHARYGYKEQLFSKIKGYHRQTKQVEPYTVFTNGGDDYERGNVAEQLSLGLSTLEASKAMVFDISVIGNNDYAWGSSQLLNYARNNNTITLASNTQYIGNDESGFAAVDFAAVQVGCLKVGFFGMTSVPWDELNQPQLTPPIPNFLPDFKMNWEWQAIAQSLVDTYRDDVDYLVMLSHLGVAGDTNIAEQIEGVDLVLGGHTHGGESLNQLENGALVIQPDFFAKGITDLTLRFNTTTKTLVDYTYLTRNTESLNYVDSELALKIDEIMGRYAPDAETALAYSENFPTKEHVAQIQGQAAIYVHQVDAALIDPSLVQNPWTPGKISQQKLHETYYTERQPSDSPGFNSLYAVNVLGSELKQLASLQPSWQFSKADNNEIIDSQTYSLALQKGAAFNPAEFFQGITYDNPVALSESWWSLDQYGRNRTSQCLHIDTDKTLDACIADQYVTIWNFDDINNPFISELGPSELNFFDPDNNQWWLEESEVNLASSFSLPLLNNQDSGVLAFSAHSPRQGLQLTHNVPANGDFTSQKKVGDYTIVMDLLWPEQSTNQYRALLQTNIANTDDADLFVDRDTNGVGISTRDSGFFGQLQANTWYRIAFVFYAAPEQGALKVFINGELVGEKDEGLINERWALGEQLLLFTDDTFESEPGYLNALLFAGRSFSEDEIKRLAGPTNTLRFSQPIRQLKQKVERHAESVNSLKQNPGLQQR